MVDPGVLGLDGGVDRNEVSRPQVGDAVGDPVDVLLDRHEHVDEHGRAARPRDGEQVRESRGRDAEVRARPGRPLVPQLHASGAGDIGAEQRPGHGVETGGEHDDVDGELVGRGPDAGRGDLGDRRGADVDESDVVAVVRRVVVGVEARTLRAERMVPR